jgi:hypothetical protein
VTGTSHLKPTNQNTQQREEPQNRLKFPSPEQRVQQRRPKVYRIVLHSDDRVAGTPTAATFDLGDLKGAWGLASDNLDAGKVHYLAKLETFRGGGVWSDVVEVRAEGFPMQRESFDSSAVGADLLGLAWSGASANLVDNAPFTLPSLPGGRVTIRLRARDGLLANGQVTHSQQSLDADITQKWHLVLSITPQEV